MKVDSKNVQKLIMKVARKKLEKSLRLTKKEKCFVRVIDKAIIAAINNSYLNMSVNFSMLGATEKEAEKLLSFYRQKRGIGCVLSDDCPNTYRLILLSSNSNIQQEIM